jgi:signal transduction histidine kinase/CheY-like chemotaxis protein
MTAEAQAEPQFWESDANLEDLRRPILEGLCIAAILLSWVWIGVIATLLEQEPVLRLPPLLPPAALFVGGMLGLFASRAPLRWRGILFLASLFGAVIPWAHWPAPGGWLFFPSLVVSVAGLLMGPRIAFFSAAALSAALGLYVWAHDARVLLTTLSMPLTLLWATAVVTWLSSRNLYTVLSWALSSQARAWETASEARQRREQLRSTVDSLRTTHELLERSTRELDLSRREAESAKQLKVEFAANISHELRTPLNIILGFTEIMSRSPEVYGDMQWPPLLRRDVLEIRRNARYLSEFVDDILDLARMDALRMPIHREATHIGQVIHEAVDIVQRLLENRPVQLLLDVPEHLPEVQIDRTRIRQVLINLLTNACRFTEQGHITVRAVEQDEAVQVSVADTGAGIPSDKLEHIFDEFSQAGLWKRPEGSGKGLGLAIAKQLVALHWGRIWVESALEQGSTFSFTLPLAEGEALRLIRSGERRPPVSRELPQLVMLDEDELSTTYLRRHLDGYDIRQAAHAGEARALVERLHPQAVLVNLPPHSGLGRDLLDALALPPGVPAIGCSLPSRAWLLKDERFAACLIKPVSSAELMRLVQRLAPAGDVLVVDDDRGFVQFVERSFQARGWGERLQRAYDGQAALAKMRQAPPALALLDLILPEMDGFQVAEAMRSDESLMRVPVVLVSGANLGEDALAMEGDVFMLTKGGGFRGSELPNLLKSALASIRADYVSGRDSLAEPAQTARARPAF